MIENYEITKQTLSTECSAPGKHEPTSYSNDLENRCCCMDSVEVFRAVHRRSSSPAPFTGNKLYLQNLDPETENGKYFIDVIQRVAFETKLFTWLCLFGNLIMIAVHEPMSRSTWSDARWKKHFSRNLQWSLYVLILLHLKSRPAIGSSFKGSSFYWLRVPLRASYWSQEVLSSDKDLSITVVPLLRMKW